MRREQVSAIINLLEPSDALQPLTAVRPVGMLPFGVVIGWLIFNYRVSSMRGFKM